MKDYTIHDIATILELGQEFKDDLLQNFEYYDEESKCNIQKILWDGLHELKKRLAQLKYDKLLIEVEEGKRKLTTDLYQEAVKQVWKDFDDILGGKRSEISQIEQVKKQLEQYLPVPTQSSPAALVK